MLLLLARAAALAAVAAALRGPATAWQQHAEPDLREAAVAANSALGNASAPTSNSSTATLAGDSEPLSCDLDGKEPDERRLECLGRGVLLVSAGIREGRLKTIERYRGFFWDIVYACPEPTLYRQMRANRIAVHSCFKFGNPKEQQLGRTDVFFAALAEITALLANASAEAWGVQKRTQEWSLSLRRTGFADLKGVLFAHTDFWMTPTFARGFSFDSVWTLPQKCTSKQEALRDSWWMWMAGPPGRGKNLLLRNGSAAETAAAVLTSMGGDAGAADALCTGWSDMFYLPRKAWGAWGHWLPRVQASGLGAGHCEISGPLVLSHITRAASGPRAQELHCWGSCCDNGRDPKLFRRHACGHRFDLTDEVMRKAFEDLWDAYRAGRQ